jgi:hypothetical protein
MKRKINFCLCLSIFLFIFINSSHAVDWLTANQVTLAWNPVTSMEGGAAIPEGDVISYEVFSVPEIGDKALDLKLEGETLSTEMTISFIEEGRFYLGVRAVRQKYDKRVSQSQVIWTDDPGAMKDGKAQGVIFSRAPSEPLDLEIK